MLSTSWVLSVAACAWVGSAAATPVSGPIPGTSVATVHVEDGPTVLEVADHRKMREGFADTVAGMKKTGTTGERTSMAVMRMSTANVEYAADADDSSKLNASVQVMHYGVGEMMGMMTMWQQLEIDNDSDDGFERTEKLGGFAALVRYRFDEKEGDVTLVLSRRMMMTVMTRHLEPDAMRKFIEDLPLGKLAELAKEVEADDPKPQE